MHRGQAIAAMDKLTSLGYSVSLAAHSMRDYVGPDVDENGVRYTVQLAELGVDKIDLKALVEVADELELDVGYSPVRGGMISFGLPDIRPEAVRTLRRHPREKRG